MSDSIINIISTPIDTVISPLKGFFFGREIINSIEINTDLVTLLKPGGLGEVLDNNEITLDEKGDYSVGIEKGNEKAEFPVNVDKENISLQNNNASENFFEYLNFLEDCKEEAEKSLENQLEVKEKEFKDVDDRVNEICKNISEQSRDFIKKKKDFNVISKEVMKDFINFQENRCKNPVILAGNMVHNLNFESNPILFNFVNHSITGAVKADIDNVSFRLEDIEAMHYIDKDNPISEDDIESLDRAVLYFSDLNNYTAFLVNEKPDAASQEDLASEIFFNTLIKQNLAEYNNKKGEKHVHSLVDPIKELSEIVRKINENINEKEGLRVVKADTKRDIITIKKDIEEKLDNDEIVYFTDGIRNLLSNLQYVALNFKQSEDNLVNTDIKITLHEKISVDGIFKRILNKFI